MADKIQNAYETSKNIYDDVLTQGSIFSKLYIKLFWGGTDDNKIAEEILSYISNDFNDIQSLKAQSSIIVKVFDGNCLNVSRLSHPSNSNFPISVHSDGKIIDINFLSVFISNFCRAFIKKDIN